jgi:hypothetical protein
MVKIGAEGHEMGDDRHLGLDRVTAERLVNGERVDPTRLADLFADVTLPGHPSELTGEARAVAAFRAAQATTAGMPAAARVPAAPAGMRARRTVLIRWGTAKVAVTASVVMAFGVAIASAAGVIPNPLIDRPVSTQSPSRAGTTPGLTPGGPVGESVSSNAALASVDAAMAGLCHWYLEASDRTKILENPAFSRLVEAAAGAEHVDTYCAAFDASKNATATSSVDANNSAYHEPTDHPTGPPSPHPEPGR